jgi:predicted Ser/Thr protein kinase
VSALKICPTCSTEYPANERFCPRDGTALRSQTGAADLVGSIIAERYHVIKKLGEGGMGQVYLAEHVKMGRKSAVKVMNPGMVHDADAIGRFNREASNASRINHPNVAGIYDFGETADGLVYLAMEFIEGETLTDIVKANGALPPQRAADITRQAAEGLYAAHHLGIVHRDLKPDNIMVAKDRDGMDCVKVVDFGIAKAQGNENQKVTRTGMVIGTPEYMSPEQLAGDALDGRTDQYSLALVAFNMLTGQLPFPSDTSQTSMIMRLTEKPKRLIEMKPDLPWPADVQAVMDKALERESAKRYASAREFGRALAETVGRMPLRPSGEAGTLVMEAPVSRTPAPATPLPTRQAPAKSKTPMLIGAAVLVALLAAGGMFYARGKTPAAPLAVASTQQPIAASVPVPAPTTPVVTPGTGTVTAAGAPAGAAVTPAAAAPAPEGPNPALADDIKKTTAHAGSESTARRALEEVKRLETLATSPEDKVSVAMARAQAYGTLGEDAKSCKTMKAVEGLSKGTTHEVQIRDMLAICAKL